MKSRTGFVSNSSSCSYIIYYNDGGYLKNAEEILEYIRDNKNCSLYILGKGLAEGRDYFFLEKKHKDLILKFSDAWLQNGDKVQALVCNKGLYTKIPKYPKDRHSSDLSEFKHHVEFEEDYQCSFDDEKSLEDFYSYYFLDEWVEEEDSIDLPKCKPYVLLYRDRFKVESEEQWNSIINCPNSFPLLIAKGSRDKDYVRTLSMVDSVPDYEVSYRDYFYLSKNTDRWLLEVIAKKVIKKKLVTVYTDAFISRNGESPHMYPLVFHAKPMFGAYKIYTEDKEVQNFL